MTGEIPTPRLPHGRPPADVVDALRQAALWLDAHDRFHASLLPPGATPQPAPAPREELLLLADWFACRPVLAWVAWNDVSAGRTGCGGR